MLAPGTCGGGPWLRPTPTSDKHAGASSVNFFIRSSRVWPPSKWQRAAKPAMHMRPLRCASSMLSSLGRYGWQAQPAWASPGGVQELHNEGASFALVMALIWRVPLLWLATIVIRAVCIMLLNPLFRAAGQRAPGLKHVAMFAGPQAPLALCSSRPASPAKQPAARVLRAARPRLRAPSAEAPSACSLLHGRGGVCHHRRPARSDQPHPGPGRHHGAGPRARRGQAHQR